jgi:hypothetical protein
MAMAGLSQNMDIRRLIREVSMIWQIYFMRRAKVKMLSNGLY